MSWNQLLSIIQEAAAEREYWATTPPMACPNDGEPLVTTPSGAENELYCPWGDFKYPRDWIRPPL